MEYQPARLAARAWRRVAQNLDVLRADEVAFASSSARLSAFNSKPRIDLRGAVCELSQLLQLLVRELRLRRAATPDERGSRTGSRRARRARARDVGCRAARPPISRVCGRRSRDDCPGPRRTTTSRTGRSAGPGIPVPLYQATNSVAVWLPGRSSPGTPSRRSASAPHVKDDRVVVGAQLVHGDVAPDGDVAQQANRGRRAMIS